MTCKHAYKDLCLLCGGSFCSSCMPGHDCEMVLELANLHREIRNRDAALAVMDETVLNLRALVQEARQAYIGKHWHERARRALGDEPQESLPEDSAKRSTDR